MLPWLEFKASLDAKVIHLKIHVVVFKFMVNVEIGIIPCVEFVRIERSGSVQSVRVRVDVEIALNFSGDRIQFLPDCSRSPLLTERSIANEICGKPFLQLVRSVQIDGVAIYLALLRPARIVHCADGRIGLSLLGTSGN